MRTPAPGLWCRNGCEINFDAIYLLFGVITGIVLVMAVLALIVRRQDKAKGRR